MQAFIPFFVTLTKAFLNIIVCLIQVGCPGLLVDYFIGQQVRIHEEYQVFLRSVLFLTDNVSVPQTLDHSVNQGFAKLVSSTSNSSIECHFMHN